METWELTEYERERQPQEITMDAEMSISPKSLYREIICPICLDFLTQTRAAPDCLHRFCKRCVEKVVKKECPICRKKLPSQVKSFKEDFKFDQLISKIRNGEQRDRPHDTSRLITAQECEIVLKPLNGARTRFIKCPHSTTVDHLSKYLSMRPESSKMPELNKDEEYKLCIVANRSEGHYEMLPGGLRLEEVKDTYKLDPNKPLELYFYTPSKE